MCAESERTFEFSVDSYLGNYDSIDTSEVLPVDLGCGNYTVTLGTGDAGHRAGYQTSQTSERWYVEGLDADGMVIYRSPITDDLPDDETWTEQIVGSASLEDVVSLRARHARLGTGVDSIHKLTITLTPS